MNLPRSDRHAFLSYVREDKERVDELQEVLEAAGISVWRDTVDLWPGDDWANKIRAAIKADSLAFIACFSSTAAEREKSYQNEELVVAAEEYRLRRPNQSWLFTVRFDECEIPHLDLGASRSLDETIQRTDVFDPGKAVQLTRLVEAVRRVVEPTAMPTVTTSLTSATKLASGQPRERADVMKALLRDPNADIALDDFLRDTAKDLTQELNDDARFPATVEEKEWVAFTPFWVETVRRYDTTIAPALEVVRLAASYGRATQNEAWERFMSHFTRRIGRDSGLRPLIDLRAYPALVFVHVVAIAAVARRNYEPLLGFVVAPTIKDDYEQNSRVAAIVEVDARHVVGNADVPASALAMSDDGRALDEELIVGLASGTVGKRYTPIADHLHGLLRDLFVDELSDDHEYDSAFDRAEVFLDAIAVDQSLQAGRWGASSGGYGRYTWRYRHMGRPIEQQMRDELDAATTSWPPVYAGLFGGSVERAQAAFEIVAENAKQIRSGRW